MKVDELELKLTESVTEVASLRSKLKRNVDSLKGLEGEVARLNGLEGEVARLKGTVDKLLPQVYALQSKLTHITSPQVSPISNWSPPPVPPATQRSEAGSVKREGEGEDVMEQNKRFLRTLSNQEVRLIFFSPSLPHMFPPRCVTCWLPWSWHSTMRPSSRRVCRGKSWLIAMTRSCRLTWAWPRGCTA